MDFGLALKYLKYGKRVAREGWNGKKMHLQLINSDSYSIKVPIKDGELIPLLPWIGMKTADDKFVPWLASQTDVLAEDWLVIE